MRPGRGSSGSNSGPPTASSAVAPAAIPHETLGQAAELGSSAPASTSGSSARSATGPTAPPTSSGTASRSTARGSTSSSRGRLLPRRSGASSACSTTTRMIMGTSTTRRLSPRRPGRRQGQRGVASFDELLGQGPTTWPSAATATRFPTAAGRQRDAGEHGGFSLQIGAVDAGLGSAVGPQVLAATRRPAPSSARRRWRSGSTSAARWTPPRSSPARRCSCSTAPMGTSPTTASGPLNWDPVNFSR